MKIERDIYDYQSDFIESELKSLMKSFNCPFGKRLQLTFKLEHFGELINFFVSVNCCQSIS